ncbi:MAG: GNAT family N-acetyltransferase [Spirochaetales bacterium]|nr:GNAT family N-acetyltransferase [Spirochaetales bacterium]MCP5485409.1 GNAT family N-acetyltransferase [Spirochaetales bacterium]
MEPDRLISTIEEQSLNAWPAHRTLLYDGWQLRFADGFTRRANSVQPLFAGHRPLDRRVAVCEAIYRSLGQPAIFRITPQANPPSLDAFLGKRGYRREGSTAVLIKKIEPGPETQSDAIVRLEERPTTPWLEGICTLHGYSSDQARALEKILERIVTRAVFVRIESASRILAAGFGVLQEASVGLFELIVDEERRRSGLGRTVASAIQGWSARNGASRVYLQLDDQNKAGKSFYERAGFVPLYHYWYRTRE